MLMHRLPPPTQGCRIYAVQCGASGEEEEDRFWQTLAYKTYGHHLSLTSFSNVFDFIMAIAYKEQGAEQLEVTCKVIRFLLISWFR